MNKNSFRDVHSSLLEVTNVQLYITENKTPLTSLKFSRRAVRLVDVFFVRHLFHFFLPRSSRAPSSTVYFLIAVLVGPGREVLRSFVVVGGPREIDWITVTVIHVAVV